jgi:hypothetical protein
VKRIDMVPETPMKMETGNNVKLDSRAESVNVSSYFSSGGAKNEISVVI